VLAWSSLRWPRSVGSATCCRARSRADHGAVSAEAAAQASAATIPFAAHARPRAPRLQLRLGIEAGLAGGAAMPSRNRLQLDQVSQPLYGINLLAAGSFIGWTDAPDSFLSQFHPQGLLAALAFTPGLRAGGLLLWAMLQSSRASRC